MGKLKSRTFSIEPGRTWSCIPADGDGPLVAREGDVVVIVVERSWERGMREAMDALTKPDPTDE